MIRVFRDLAAYSPESENGTAAAIGAFDGLHHGHRVLLSRLKAYADREGLTPVVIDFDPLPGVFFGRISPDEMLLTNEEKTAMLEELGIRVLFILPFTAEFAACSPEDFMSMMQQALHVKRLFMGDDFCLGKDRRGTPALLTELGNALGYTTDILPRVKYHGQSVSATLIRHILLGSGKWTDASKMLGYDYFITNRIIHGDGRGHTLGYPTANQLFPAGKLVLSRGVYVTRMNVRGKTLPGVTNVGIRPTFPEYDRGTVIETYLLEGGEDFFGEEATLSFLYYLRPEWRFTVPEALLSQMAGDIAAARKYHNLSE